MTLDTHKQNKFCIVCMVCNGVNLLVIHILSWVLKIFVAIETVEITLDKYSLVWMTVAVIRNEGLRPVWIRMVSWPVWKGGSPTEYSDTRCMDCHLELALDHVAMCCVMSDLRGNMQLCEGISSSLKVNTIWLKLLTWHESQRSKCLSHVEMIRFL